LKLIFKLKQLDEQNHKLRYYIEVNIQLRNKNNKFKGGYKTWGSMSLKQEIILEVYMAE